MERGQGFVVNDQGGISNDVKEIFTPDLISFPCFMVGKDRMVVDGGFS